MYISPYCRLVLVPPIFMKFGIRCQLTDVITFVKFLVDRFRGYGVLIPQNCHFPLTCCVAITTVYALPCDTVKTIGDVCRSYLGCLIIIEVSYADGRYCYGIFRLFVCLFVEHSYVLKCLMSTVTPQAVAENVTQTSKQFKVLFQ